MTRFSVKSIFILYIALPQHLKWSDLIQAKRDSTNQPVEPVIWCGLTIKDFFPVQKPPPSFRGGFQLFGNTELLNGLLHLTH
jgi:hypothetical protein